MAAQYAKDQPQGYKNHVEKVAIVGASGNMGRFFVEELLKTGKHTLTGITRADSKAEMPAGVQIKKVNYDEQKTLVDALRGQDALIITMGVTAPKEQQSKLIQAAAAADVPWIFPNEFGVDVRNDEYGRDTFLGPTHEAYRKEIEGLDKSSWIAFVCGFWYEFSLGGTINRYGFDFQNRRVMFYDDGNTVMNTSTWPQCGRAMAKLLSLPCLPDDASDKRPHLSQWKNGFFCISSFEINQQDMFDSVLRVTSTKRSDWQIENVDVKPYYQKAVEEMKSGSRLGFGKALYSRTFFPEAPGNFAARNELANKALDLPEEDLDEATKVGIELSKNPPY